LPSLMSPLSNVNGDWGECQTDHEVSGQTRVAKNWNPHERSKTNFVTNEVLN
jgi:hypothetical protein